MACAADVSVQYVSMNTCPGLRRQALNRKLMSGFQACLPGSVNRTINGPHSQILPAHTSLFCSDHSESS